MYKSPIEIIYKDAQYRMEKDIFYAIQKVDIKVDRDELLKALAYDRRQYEKGYYDAKADRKRGKWIVHNNLMYSPFDGSNENTCICNQCEAESEKATNYCPNCGADMRGKEE